MRNISWIQLSTHLSLLCLLFFSSSVRSPPQETVIQELLQQEPSPQEPFFMAGPAYIHPMGFSPSGTAFSCVSLHGVTSSARKPIPMWSLSSEGHSPWQDLVSAQASHMVTAFFGHIYPFLVWGPPQAAGRYLLPHGSPSAEDRQPASPWSLSWTAGEFALAHGASPTCPSPLTLLSGELFLQHTQSSLPGAAAQQVYPVLKRVICRHCYCWWWLGLGYQCVHLGAI